MFNVICEFLLSLFFFSDLFGYDYVDMYLFMDFIMFFLFGFDKKILNEKWIELLEGCKDEVWCFVMIFFFIFMDVYLSMVNLMVC